MTAKNLTLTDTMRTAHAPTAAAPSRRGRRGWLIYLDPDTARRLKIAATMQDRTLQSFGEEAADLMLERYGN
jgi:hypothetical protein